VPDQLTNRLFLNPINDALERSVAADDGLALPSFVTKLGEPPTLIGFFNQLKQEYVSARWAYYGGTHSDRPHFSDRSVSLFNTLDYPTYGLAIEHVRTSFRVAYSLFDKVAFFLNSYLICAFHCRTSLSAGCGGTRKARTALSLHSSIAPRIFGCGPLLVE
jgi:hypothetical protein